MDIAIVHNADMCNIYRKLMLRKGLVHPKLLNLSEIHRQKERNRTCAMIFSKRAFSDLRYFLGHFFDTSWSPA